MSGLKISAWLLLLIIYVQTATALSDTAVVRVISTIEPSCGVQFSQERLLMQRNRGTNAATEEISYLCNIATSNAFLSYRWLDIDAHASHLGTTFWDMRHPGRQVLLAPGSSQAINVGQWFQPITTHKSALVVTVINH